MRNDTERSRRLARALRKRMTEAEVILWSRLRKGAQARVVFHRQHAIGPYVADFACVAARLVVEVDGATHETDDERAHDARRDAYLAREGWKVARFTNDDVYRRLSAVLDAIWWEVDARAPAPEGLPPPLRGYSLRRRREKEGGAGER
ncbi:MAG: DUF559 domain-containing protein [Alphaproteobacteria bacterium]|nr:DUF559 domain-containing protein [Alphaproteobacteria bacterium]